MAIPKAKHLINLFRKLAIAVTLNFFQFVVSLRLCVNFFQIDKIRLLRASFLLSAKKINAKAQRCREGQITRVSFFQKPFCKSYSWMYLFRNVAIAVVSGAVAAFGQPDRGAVCSILALFFGYSGIFFLLKNVKRRAFWLAFAWALGVFSFQLSWLATTQYHGIGIAFLYAAVATLFAFQFALVFGNGITLKFSISRGLFIASLWTLFEWSRLFYFCGFPFSPVGLVLTFDPIPMQIASVLGVYGLSFIVIFTSYLIAFSRLKSVVGCFAVLCLFGLGHMRYFEGLNLKEPFYDVALIQTGLSVEEKEDIPIEKQWERIFTFLEETPNDHFDLIVLPEVVLTYGEKNRHLKIAKKLADKYKSEVVIGLIDDVYNAAFYIAPDSEIYERYEKRVLVPIGEYLPASFLKPFLVKYGITEFFNPGKNAKVFLGKIPISPSICYEEGFCNLIREGRKQGAELLVNLTNDGWFPSSRLHAEHFNLGRVRSIENGAFVLRACNTGITGVVDSFGRIVKIMKERDSQGKLNAGAQITKINGYSYPTIFSKFGNTIIISFCLSYVGLIFLIKRNYFSRVLCSI